MKRVLIITYYWPPAGGAGVQRWLKFVKYLPQYGWTPVVYTPSNPESPVDDPSLLKDIPAEAVIVKQPIWEPYSAYKKFIGQKPEQKINTGFLSENKKPKLSEKMSVWVRGNFFIPDARMFWIRPSIKYLTEYLKENPVDAIVSTGPPHSMHLIALGVKKALGIPWLADFRDPWTNIDFYQDLMLTGWADRRHRRLEKAVVDNCDHQIVVGEGMKEEFVAIGAENISVITNGYDDADIPSVDAELDRKFSIAHIGTIPRSRNPEVLWRVLASLTEERPELKSDLEIKLVGKLDVSVIDSLEKLGLMPYLNRIDYMPHDEVVKVQRVAQVLLLAVNNTPNAKGILTGKFFEYLSARRPILAIGPEDGEVARILEATGAGCISGFDNEDALKQNILRFYDAFRDGKLDVSPEGVERFSRRNLTGDITRILDKIIQ
ncbi:MAG: glycosyltransferase family 4 protein [Bacteroidota bacterium]|nr:glycosyltransferase family 4 protein [Bacteroidota bacterium]